MPGGRARSRRRFERDAVALAFQRAHGASGGAFGVAPLEIVDPWLAVLHVSIEQMIRGDQPGVRDRDDGLLVAAMAAMRR
jgi:hypothetical protein